MTIFITDMDVILVILLISAVAGLPLIIFHAKRKRSALPLPPHQLLLLNEKVDFYRLLDLEKRKEFEKRVQHFLSRVKITGVRTIVEDLDKILIASGAIIPIFGFPDWEYNNLNEVLLYPDAFDDDFKQQGGGRDILGLVGSGAYQNIMILARQQLRAGFENTAGKENTAIHEFTHLIDKTDGYTDGIPELLLSKQLITPWINLIHEKIKQIIENDSDINPYGATNQAEFFAVVSEYFFKRPDLLQIKHPDLYELLVSIFKQEPKNTGSFDIPAHSL